MLNKVGGDRLEGVSAGVLPSRLAGTSRISGAEMRVK